MRQRQVVTGVGAAVAALVTAAVVGLPSVVRPPQHTSAATGHARKAAATSTASRPLARAAVTPTPTPTPSLTAMHSWIVQTSCTADVIDSPDGSWLLTAAHCGQPDSIDAAGRTWQVVDYVAKPGDLVTNDVALIRVDGDLEKAVGGGFHVGTAPADGSTVSIWGYPSATTGQLTGCDDLTVTIRDGAAEVDSCDLPDGTSGAAWYTADGVLHGVTGGPDEGGASDWGSNTILFTDATVAWVKSVTG